VQCACAATTSSTQPALTSAPPTGTESSASAWCRKSSRPCDRDSPSIDIKVWCDVDLDTAAKRGMARDRHAGRDHEALWREIWTPNEHDFVERFSPLDRADVLYTESQ